MISMAVFDGRRKRDVSRYAELGGRLGSYTACIVWCYLNSENIDCKYRQPEF
jgi:hypothetical protein